MDDTVNIFKALSDMTRLRIIKLLENGELCVCDIEAALEMAQSKVSFHLGVLRNSGLLQDRKQGKWVHYRLDESDMFKRFLLLSVNERVSDKFIEADRSRLETFLEDKIELTDALPVAGKRTGCCKTSPG
ncbi:MAG: heavy metal resistance transcription regulator [Deltaproteobacteria bacterium]|nr:heavy metal resistance transcription regulator [Deltaproteobacteria bacterium]